jgi:hypothetical protein
MASSTKFFLFLLPTLLATLFIYTFHVVRVDAGIEIIPKDSFTHKDFYVDVRGYGLADYFYHAPKIRNYLFIDKPYNKLLSLIEEKKSELENPGADEEKTKGAMARRFKSFEKAMRKWIEIVRKY